MASELELKSINPIQPLKIVTLFLMIAFFIVGMIAFILALFKSWNTLGDTIVFFLMLIFVFSPLCGLGVSIGAWIYNVAASKVGGCKITLGIRER